MSDLRDRLKRLENVWPRERRLPQPPDATDALRRAYALIAAYRAAPAVQNETEEDRRWRSHFIRRFGTSKDHRPNQWEVFENEKPS